MAMGLERGSSCNEKADERDCCSVIRMFEDVKVSSSQDY